MRDGGRELKDPPSDTPLPWQLVPITHPEEADGRDLLRAGDTHETYRQRDGVNAVIDLFDQFPANTGH